MEQNESMKEGVLEHRQAISVKSSDDELILVANNWIGEAKTLHDKYLKKQNKNEKYYLGNQLELDKLDEYQAKIILNKVFQSLETVLPRATRQLPAPMCTLPPSDDEAEEVDARAYTQQLEDAILAIAEENKLSKKLKEFAQFHQLYYLGVLKFGYDEEEGIWVENVRPQRILVPPNMSGEYVIEWHEDTIGFLKEKFPEKKGELDKMVVDVTKANKKINDGSKVGYYEVTTEEFKFWKVNNVVLSKEENPHYNFKKKRNHWKCPKVDYLFSDMWNLGIDQYSQTTLVDQVLPLQDAVNKRKRQISDNADLANGILVGYAEGAIDKKDLAALQRERRKPNGAVLLEKAVQGSVQHFQGQLLGPLVTEDMLHTISEIDNVFGTHSTTRGEKTPGEETFGGRQLLKESDQERIDQITEMLERIAEDLYNAIAQMILVHFKEAHYITYLGVDGGSKQLKITNDLIKKGVHVRVREGSTLVKDKATRSQEALILWQNKAMDPISLYERLGDPHPYKTAERLYKWMLDPGVLFKEVQSVYDRAIKSDRQKEILESITQADIENRALINGENVPPYEGATSQHIAVHQDLFETKQFLQQPIEVRKKAAEHLRAEAEIVRTKLGETKAEKKPSGKEMLDSMSKK